MSKYTAIAADNKYYIKYLAGIDTHSTDFIGCNQKLFLLEVMSKHSAGGMLQDQTDGIVEIVWIGFSAHSNQPA